MVEVKNKRVFLSGPMSDDPDTYHVHDFVDAHIKLKRCGAFHVFNPAIKWLEEDCETQDHEYYMRKCIWELLSETFSFEPDTGRESTYDLLVQLHGWDASEGARTEYEVAKACGIPVCGIDEVV